jgi:hypothetical protein
MLRHPVQRPHELERTDWSPPIVLDPDAPIAMKLKRSLKRVGSHQRRRSHVLGEYLLGLMDLLYRHAHGLLDWPLKMAAKNRY